METGTKETFGLALDVLNYISLAGGFFFFFGYLAYGVILVKETGPEGGPEYKFWLFLRTGLVLGLSVLSSTVALSVIITLNQFGLGRFLSVFIPVVFWVGGVLAGLLILLSFYLLLALIWACLRWVLGSPKEFRQKLDAFRAERSK